MEKKILKERLNDLVNQIKTNSKDSHFANKLIEDLLSVKGQMMIEPIELDCGKKIDEYLGETFRITLTDRGVLYHEYGGYNIFVTPNNTALYQTLEDLVVNREKYNSGEDINSEDLELIMTAIAYCLIVPKIAFGDTEFMFEIAKMVIEHIRKQYEDLMSKDLQEETIAEDEEFKNATLALEDIKANLNEEGK